MRCWLRWWCRCGRSWRRCGQSWRGRWSGSLSLRRGWRRSPRNSSKPPSSEGLAKPAPRSLRKSSGRRPGGQDGHKGATLAQMARPDREVRHEPGCCCRCGAGLAGRPVTWVERRQVFDLPPLRAEVTEHQLIERECGCGQRTRAAAPPGAEGPVCYGPRIAAVIVYLYIGQFLSKKRTAQALAELFGVPLSSGTVASVTGRAARAAGRVPGAGPRADRAQRRGRVRRDRVPRRRQAGLGALRPHRQVHPAHGAPQARQAGHGGDGDPARVRRGRRA